MVKFRYYNSGSTFNSDILSNDDIAFVEDTGSIWTHGIEFGGSNARASNMIASYVEYSTTQATGVATSLTVDGCENIIYKNTGISDITLPIATSQSGVTVVITDDNTSLTIPSGGYAEVNFVRVTTGNTTRVFVRSIVSE